MTVVDPIAPPMVAMAMQQLSECVCEQLETVGAGPTCWCGILPGAAAAWDYCAGECTTDRCGIGWVRLVSVFPYGIFPTPTPDDRCVLPLAWTVEVGALRCMPLTLDGSPLDPVTMSDVALRQILDARALHWALKCCDLPVAANVYTPLGPDGGCVGGAWTAWLTLD